MPLENIRGRAKVEAGQLCLRKNGRGVDPNRNWDYHWGEKEKGEHLLGAGCWAACKAMRVSAAAEIGERLDNCLGDYHWGEKEEGGWCSWVHRTCMEHVA